MKFKISLFLSMLFACLGSLNAQVTLDIDSPIGPSIEYFGWDLKGGTNRGNPLSRAETYYNTGANLVRIPVFANAHFEDGSVDQSQYTNLLSSISNILTVNPDTKIFASLRLEGANTFPEWIESDNDGVIFGNVVKRPDPEKYSQLLADYVEFMFNEGVKIEFFGILNETDQAVLPDEYVSTVRMLRQKLIDRGIPEEFRSMEWIGPDTFRVGPADTYAAQVIAMGGSDTLTIGGAHMYTTQHFENGNDVWGDLAAVLPTGTPLWHTELHLNQQSAFPNFSNTTLVRNTFAVLGGSSRSGIMSFTWWGGGDSPTRVDHIMKRRAIEIVLGSQQVATTPVHPVQFFMDNPGNVYQAYLKDGRLNVVLINQGGAIQDFQIDVLGGEINQVLAVESYQGPGDEIGDGAVELTLVPTVIGNGTGVLIEELPSDSINRIEIQLVGETKSTNGSFLTQHSHDNVNGNPPVSPFFSSLVRQDNGHTLTFSPSGGLSGSAEPGDTMTTVSGTFMVNGNSTFDSCYADGNAVPDGMTLSLDVSFDLAGEPGDTLSVSGGNSGNGLGVSASNSYYDNFRTGDVLNVSNVSVSNVQLTGTPVEPGVNFSALSIDDLSFYVFRSNNFSETGNGAILTGSAGSIGFGIANGTLESNVPINNNFSNEFTRVSLLNGPVTLEGMNIDNNANFHLKGFGLETAFSYEFAIGGFAFVPTTTVTRERGNPAGGTEPPLSDYQTDDNIRALWNPGFTLNSTEAPVWIRFEANAPSASQFVVESQAGTPGLTLTVEAWNFTNSSYDNLGEFAEGFNSDSTSTVALTADHIDSSGNVQSRVGWRRTGFTINFPWEVRIDLAGWN